MNILATQYTLKYKSFEVAISGCKGKEGTHCSGCHSPETWDFEIGEPWTEWKERIAKKINAFSDMINWIWIYGGEPNDNNLDDLKEMLLFLKSFNKPLVLFTRYAFNEVPDFEKEICDFIKCGEYKDEYRIDDNIQYGIQIATSNQKIYAKGMEY